MFVRYTVANIPCLAGPADSRPLLTEYFGARSRLLLNARGAGGGVGSLLRPNQERGTLESRAASQLSLGILVDGDGTNDGDLHRL